MRPRSIVIATSLGLAALSAVAAPDPDWKVHMGGLPFVVGIDRGREESRFMGLPQMLVFTSATDPDCPKFADTVWKDPDVRTKVAGWTPVLIDFDTAPPELKTRCKVEMVPSVVWLDHDEKWLWACNGNAPIEAFRKETTIARRVCPRPKAPAEGLKALQEAKKRLDEAEAAKDVKAQLAAVADIRKIRFGEAFQVAARATDERLTKDGLVAVATFAAVLDEKQSPREKKAEARTGLENLIALYGADHAVAQGAKAALDRAVGKKNT